MERYLEKIKSILTADSISFSERTYAQAEGLRIICANIDGEDKLIVDGSRGFRFKGEAAGGPSGIRICPMDRANRTLLQLELRFCSPTAVGGDESSRGCESKCEMVGDRTVGEIVADGIKPFFMLKGKPDDETCEKLLDEAVWQVLGSGFKEGFGVAAEPLDSLDDIQLVLRHGFSMLTVDASGMDDPDLAVEFISEACSMVRKQMRRIDLTIITGDVFESLDSNTYELLMREMSVRRVPLSSIRMSL